MAEAFVVDASVAAKWHLPDEDDVGAANLLLVRFAAGELALVAPGVIHLEVASAISAATLGQQPRLSIQEGELAIAAFLATAIETRSERDLIPTAFTLVHHLGCAFYDALYLALAQRLGIAFITADRRLHRRIGHLPDIVWLANYPSSPSV